MTTTERKQALENQLSQIAGLPVEVTIRGLRAFTFSFESVNASAVAAIENFFAGNLKMTVETDDECGTFIYATI
jgi:phosphatidylserine decarboxylase